MTPYSFVRPIAQAVAQDPALQAWAAANFDSPLACYFGLPSVDFPEMDADAPFVVFGDPSKRSGEQSGRVIFGVDVWLGLRIADYQVTAIENYYEPAGVQLVTDGMAKVLDAVRSAIPVNDQVLEAAMDFDTLGAHDEVHGYMTLEFIHDCVLGEHPLD